MNDSELIPLVKFRQGLDSASLEDLRERARKARELGEVWHELMMILAEELEALAVERETARRAAE